MQNSAKNGHLLVAETFRDVVYGSEHKLKYMVHVYIT